MIDTPRQAKARKEAYWIEWRKLYPVAELRYDSMPNTVLENIKARCREAGDSAAKKVENENS